jgi:hypothetical protein
MIPKPFSVKRYRSAQDRFFKPALKNFFATEFPRLFGPVMRENLAEALLDLITQMYPERHHLQPGQVLWNALDKHTRADSPTRKYIPVVLSLVTEEDVKLMSTGASRKMVTEQAIARIIREAYQQGGILSMRDIALLTLRTDSYVSVLRKSYEKEHETILPHTGVLHDMGSCISHKSVIVRKVMLEKKDPLDVARETAHSQQAVDQYLNDYHRVKAVYDYNQDVPYIHLVTGIAKHVIKEYVEIITLCQK